MNMISPIEAAEDESMPPPRRRFAQRPVWQRTAAITLESYHTALSQHFGNLTIPVGHTPTAGATTR